MKLFIFLLLVSLTWTSTFAKKIEYDKETGLIVAKGVEIVKGHCTACHSAKFIILQKGDRETWLSMIRWMQRTQGLWAFDKKSEDTILTYLSTNYPPGKESRRPNLKIGDMPKNPYAK